VNFVFYIAAENLPAINQISHDHTLSFQHIQISSMIRAE